MTTREKIVHVAAQQFAERGYDGVSVRDIVREANVNLGAITYHFGGKENLFGEVTVLRGEPLRKIAIEVSASKDSPDQKLRKLCRAFAFHVLREDPALRVMFLELLSGGQRLPKASVERVTWRNRLIGKIIQDGIDQGLFRKCSVESVVWSLNGLFMPYILFPQVAGKISPRGRYSKAAVERIVDDAMSVFLEGIAAKPRRKKS